MFEEDVIGDYSMEVLIQAVKATYGSNLLHYSGTQAQIPSQFIGEETEGSARNVQKGNVTPQSSKGNARPIGPPPSPSGQQLKK